MATLTFPIRIDCAGCGRTLPDAVPFDGWVLRVPVCRTCGDRENDRGFYAGYKKGWNEAKAEQPEVV